ncbi:hypothetical protein HU200_010742 [Digitaria exilis]|uniref:Reverse transcriptase zinc-binding domain-containing protein n=1 Tax=Digitaria exilis TaxID=1010633 RepID=A0A835FHT1_9POAL|nr:hypothetical protein HU200_010742 [Digitaria exilis]
MAKIVQLGYRIHAVQLEDRQDEIHQRWTADGKYISKSAYNAQLLGAYCTFDSASIWKANMEGKHRIFTWLMVHGMSMEVWWNSNMQGRHKKLKQKMASLMIYTAWNLWKERNRRMFERLFALPTWVVSMIKEEIRIRHQACGGEDLLHVS